MIVEYVKSINAIARSNNLQLNYIQGLNELSFKQNLGFDYTIPLKLVTSASCLSSLKEYLNELDFLQDVTSPLIYLHNKGICSILLVPAVRNFSEVQT